MFSSRARTILNVQKRQLMLSRIPGEFRGEEAKRHRSVAGDRREDDRPHADHRVGRRSLVDPAQLRGDQGGRDSDAAGVSAVSRTRLRALQMRVERLHVSAFPTPEVDRVAPGPRVLPITDGTLGVAREDRTLALVAGQRLADRIAIIFATDRPAPGASPADSHGSTPPSGLVSVIIKHNEFIEHHTLA
jgi:hypothetical protein